ncbi:MAG: SH3 domain-containing protein [Chloroflexi bacterium]|nr:SH3 domain-containing protein [Chloroflexota bacterium]
MALRKWIWLLLGLAWLMPVVAQAQSDTDCPEIVQTAFVLTTANCDTLERNQACYGHLVLDAEPQTGYPNFTFEQPGDVVNVVEVRTLRLSAMDENTGAWGVAMIKIQADLEQTMPQDVTFLMFGDVALDNATQLIPVTAISEVNIRSEPSTVSTILATLETGDVVTASGRLEDSSWLRVLVPGQPDKAGWVFVELVRADAEVTTLPVIDLASLGDESAEIGPQYGPMQAFYFQTGTDDAGCPEAPNSGLLIQTPEGVAEVTLLTNEVDVQLSGTAYLEAQAGGEMAVNVVEGSAQVTSMGVTRTAVAGTSVSVPMSDTLAPLDVPGPPEPYDEDTVQNLPTNILDRPVTVAPPLETQAGVPLDGEWQFVWAIEDMACPDGTTISFEGSGLNSVTIQDSGASLVLSIGEFTRVAEGQYRRIYTDDTGNLHRDTLQVEGPDLINGEAVIEFSELDCTLTAPFSLLLLHRP